MPNSLKVPKKEGEKARKLLKKLDLINHNYKISKDKKNIYLPIKGEIKEENKQKIRKEIRKPSFVEKKLQQKNKKPNNLDDVLKNQLNEKELNLVPSSYDIIGDIAVIELSEELLKKKKLVGEALMEVHKNIETVLLQKSPVTGEFRVKDLKVIAGENKTKTIHKEHGSKFIVDLKKVFFSPRLSHEREVIMEQVKEKEKVFDMFAGVGPFSIIIANKKKPKKVYAVDKNPEAIKLLQKNIELNNLENKIKAIQGDIKKIAPKYKNSSDRAIMNLPFKSGSFLLEAMELIKKSGGIIHYYDIRDEENLFDDAIKKIQEKAQKIGYDTEILNKRIVRSYSPKTWNIAIDVKLIN